MASITSRFFSRVRRVILALLPQGVWAKLQPAYHLVLARLASLYYRNPSRKLCVVAVTGTKGKSSVLEIANAIFEEAGYQTALASTIRFKIGDREERNLFKMTMPGRFFLQRFLREAVDAECQYAFIEMTSEGARLWRHVGIDLDALIFTNLHREHIESHGSFEKYKACKLRLRDALVRSAKKEKNVIVNADDAHAADFLEVPESVHTLTYALNEAKPYATNDRGSLMTIGGTSVHSPLVGEFNIRNILAAVRFAQTQGLSIKQMRPALERFGEIKGRVQKIDRGQPYLAIVDYAHTPESLEALYTAFPKKRLICVLGNTGGGRDQWKRPLMGEIADRHCDAVFLTNEDPYDEDPREIVDAMAAGMKAHTPNIILDRRTAIRQALREAKKGDVVLITGKGTDPYIMGPNETRQEWSDAQVVAEELEKLVASKDKKEKRKDAT